MNGQAVTDAPPPNAAGGAAPASAPRLPRGCPECLARVSSPQPAALFCSPEHKRAWHIRARSRGGVLLALAMAARQTRGGTRGPEHQRAIGRRARADADQLMQRWKEEDRAAGRMSAIDYITLRYRYGLVDVVR